MKCITLLSGIINAEELYIKKFWACTTHGSLNQLSCHTSNMLSKLVLGTPYSATCKSLPFLIFPLNLTTCGLAKPRFIVSEYKSFLGPSNLSAVTLILNSSSQLNTHTSFDFPAPNANSPSLVSSNISSTVFKERTKSMGSNTLLMLMKLNIDFSDFIIFFNSLSNPYISSLSSRILSSFSCTINVSSFLLTTVNLKYLCLICMFNLLVK
eukprot:Anaeramoba_flamelloidesa325815_181.p2 GENE.a325815_181~~a325815_181.p2  ORF type:complete len:210 (-),score=-14.27 a325815_181:2938-3567(-)